jgi:hypothetical protein
MKLLETLKERVLILDGGLTLYGRNPYEIAARLDKSDADVIGSNCGTTPAHTQALAEALEGSKPGKRKLRPIAVSRHKEERLEERITSPLAGLLLMPPFERFHLVDAILA